MLYEPLPVATTKQTQVHTKHHKIDLTNANSNPLQTLPETETQTKPHPTMTDSVVNTILFPRHQRVTPFFRTTS